MWFMPVVLTKMENDQDSDIPHYDVKSYSLNNVTYMDTGVCRQHYSMNNCLFEQVHCLHTLTTDDSHWYTKCIIILWPLRSCISVVNHSKHVNLFKHKLKQAYISNVIIILANRTWKYCAAFMPPFGTRILEGPKNLRCSYSHFHRVLVVGQQVLLLNSCHCLV